MREIVSDRTPPPMDASARSDTREPRDSTSDGVQPTVGSISLWRIGLGLTFAQITTYVTLFATTTVLLPAEIVRAVGNADKEVWLGIITTAAAAVSLVLGPFIGVVSDRTRHRLGRRTPWILLGGVAASATLAMTGWASRPIPLLVTWCLAQAAVGLITMPMSTVLPERVPLERRGTLSGVTGLATTVSVASAGFVGAAFVSRPGLGMTMLGGTVLVGAAGFAVIVPDRSSQEADPVPGAERGTRVRGSVFIAFADHDFRWVWIGRFTIVLGYQMLLTRMLFFVQDRFAPNLDAAATTVASLTAASGLFTVIGLVVSGPLSDRFGRKPFVYFGGTVVGVGLLLTTQVASEGQFVAAWGVVSLAFGCFVGVDGALAADVLPDAKHAGRDLGVIGLAQVVPQTLAPAFGSAVLLATGGSYSVLLLIGALAAFTSVAATRKVGGAR